MNHKIVFKTIMLGQQSVGKSSMIIRYVKGNFSEQYNVTVGVEFATKNIIVEDGQPIKLQLWDTAGQQTFKAIVRTFYKGIAGVFLTFAINNAESLQGVKMWLKEVREHGHEEVVFFLVGTKADLAEQREVTQDQVKVIMKEIGAVFYIETSAKQGTGLEQMFAKAGAIMYKKYKSNHSFKNLVSPMFASSIEQPKAHSLDLNQVKMEPQSRKCCK